MRFITTLTCAVFLLLSGCATQPQFKPMPAAAVGKINDADITVAVPQKEIVAQIERSNISGATGGGLLFALIDAAVESHRATEAEKQIAALRNSIVDYNFNAVALREVREQTEAISWIAGKNVRAVTDISEENIEKELLASKKDTFVSLNFEYFLSVDKKSVSVGLTANAYPNTGDLTALQISLYKDTTRLNDENAKRSDTANSLFRDWIVYTESLAEGMKTPEEALAIWARDGGARMRDALDRGAHAVVRVLAKDFMDAAASDLPQNPGTSEAQHFVVETSKGVISATRWPGRFGYTRVSLKKN